MATNISIGSVPTPNYQPRSVTLTLLTGLTPNVDIGSIVIPSQFTNYLITNIYVRSVTASGSLAAATIDLRTAANGGGTSILGSPTALTGLTAAALVQSITPVLTSVMTASQLFVYQSVGAGSTGTIKIVLQIIDLT